MDAGQGPRLTGRTREHRLFTIEFNKYDAGELRIAAQALESLAKLRDAEPKEKDSMPRCVSYVGDSSGSVAQADGATEDTYAKRAYDRVDDVAVPEELVIAPRPVESTPEPTPAVPEKAPDAADVAEATQVYANKNGVPAALKLIESFGVKRAGDIPEAKRAEFIAATK